MVERGGGKPQPEEEKNAPGRFSAGETTANNAFSSLVRSAALQKREQGDHHPSSVYDRVSEMMAEMLDDFPEKNWETPKDEEMRDNIYMVWYGFRLSSYEHLSATRQAALQDRLYEHSAADYTSFTKPLSQGRGIYKDRIELNYDQAVIVHKITEALNLNYDPGTPEETPENTVKRTFYYDNFIGRAIPFDEDGRQLARPRNERKIREYVKRRERKA